MRRASEPARGWSLRATCFPTAGRTVPLEKLECAAARAARRPGRTVLDCRLFRLVTGHEMPAWQSGVDEYLRRQA